MKFSLPARQDMPWSHRSKEESDWQESQEALLAEQGTDGQERLQNRPSSLLRRSFAVKGAFIFLLFALAGFVVGWMSFLFFPRNSTLAGAVPTVPIGQILSVFGSHREFMTPPPSDNSSEPAWDALLPRGLGYVKSPDTTSPVATIGAFHELHCLYTLRRIFYATLGEAQQGIKPGSTLAPFDNGVERTEHAGHCFEYLRQALICNADASLEPFDGSEEGFPGMGFQRQCRDYDALKVYAEKYKALDAQGFIYEGSSPHVHDSK